MQTYEPMAGERIEDAARTLAEMAPARMMFNGAIVEAHVGDSPRDVHEAWIAETNRIFLLPENVAKRTQYAAEQEAGKAQAQAEIDRLVAVLPGVHVSDSRAAIRWLVEMQPHADRIGVKYDRDSVVATFIQAGYTIGGSCSEEGESVDHWKARVGESGQRRWLIGQALDGIVRVGAPHQVIHSFAAEMGIA